MVSRLVVTSYYDIHRSLDPMLMLFFSSLALGFFLNDFFESNFLGFVIIGLIYLLICILLVVFKNRIITNHLFQALFSDTLTGTKVEQEIDQQD